MKRLLIFIAIILNVTVLKAQVSGIVLDENGNPLCGVSAQVVEDPLRKVITQRDGSFNLDAEEGEIINFSIYGRYSKNVLVEKPNFSVQFSVADRVLETNFGKTSHETSTLAFSQIHSDEIAEFNPKDAYASLFGTLPGLTTIQRTGWNDVKPELYVRGIGTLSSAEPLIVIDGIVRDMSYLSACEIESVSVLKDAAGASLYGMRGANGVIQITTKRGSYNTMKASVDYQFGVDLPFNMPHFVDAPTYAEAYNEACVNDGLPVRYAPSEIEAYRTGQFPDLYPNVNWLDEGMRDIATNHQFGFTFSGGGKNLRFFTHVDYQNYMGMINKRWANANGKDYSDQLRKNKLSARVNLDANLTKSTFLKVGLHGLIAESQSPIGGSENIFPKLYNTPANAFPIRTSEGYWGASNLYPYNPFALISDSGYQNRNISRIQADVTLTQDFSMWVKGLKASLSAAWDNAAVYHEHQKKNYEYQIMLPYISESGIMPWHSQIYGENSSLAYESFLQSQNMSAVFNGMLSYNRSFGKHIVDANVTYRQEINVAKGRNTTRKYQDVIFHGGYDYDGRYLLNIVANYSGASVLSSGSKFDFYPAVSAAWVISNEPFVKSNAIDLMKLRLSWGRSGFTGFGYELDRYLYVHTDGYYFSLENRPMNGYREGKLPVADLKSQMAETMNVGFDMTLLRGLDFSVDFFKEDRTRILLPTDELFSGILGTSPAQSCNGEVSTWGTELSLGWKQHIGDFTYSIGGNFSFARSLIVENNEGRKPFDYLSAKNQRVGQFFGLEADGFFNDWEEIEHAPAQKFSEVRPGDVRYIDQNNDNKIDANDYKAFGYSTMAPEINYGLNISFDWKGLGFSAQFQGTGNYSTVLSTPGLYQPISNHRNLSTWYMEDQVRWTPETKDVATLPRLSTLVNKNNEQNSTLWLADASYFRLRNLYLYWNLPEKWFSKNGKTGLQIYLRGENLFSVDKIPYSNPDNVGVLFPDVRSVYCGLKFKF